MSKIFTVTAFHTGITLKFFSGAHKAIATCSLQKHLISLHDVFPALQLKKKNDKNESKQNVQPSDFTLSVTSMAFYKL